MRLAIMEWALMRAGLVEGKGDSGASVVPCFICEREVSRTEAEYDPEFDLWECEACLKKWGR